MRLLSGDDDRFALHRYCGLDTAGLRKKPGIKRLNAMSVDALATGLARQQGRDYRRDLRVDAGSSDLEPNMIGRANRVDADLAATRDGLSGNDKHVEEQFDQVLRLQSPWQVPGELGFVVLEESPRDGLSIAQIDLGTGRPGCSERDPAELQLRRSCAGAFLDQVECELSRAFVLLFLEHLKSVNDRANGTDEIVAYARAQQGGEIERFDGRFGHRLVSTGDAGCHNWRIDGRARMAR